MAIPYISRSRLLDRLNLGIPLVYIYGPTGSGKTALLREWCNLQDEQAIWFTCTEIDNDPLCLWQRLTYIAGIEDNSAAFYPGIFPSSLDIALIALMKWIEQQPRTIHLVLDDYHVLQSTESRGLVRHLLQIKPPNFHIFIASHFRDSDLPLNQGGLSEQAIEIIPSDLAFTVDEICALLERLPCSYSEDEVQRLFTYTNGWVGGIQLLLMRGKKPTSTSTYLPADLNQMVDELCGEVFAEFPEDYQTFLIQVSILDVLTVENCKAVTLNTRSQVILEILFEQMFLLLADDTQQKFFIPSIWLHFLHNKINNPEELHCRAAQWYQHRNDLDHAINHALKGNNSLAVDLIRQQGRSKIERGELVTLRNWLEQVPDTAIQADSDLSLIYAWALVHHGYLDKAERYLHHPDHALCEVYTIRARIAAMRGDKPLQIDYSEKALPLLAETEFSLRADLLLNLGCAYLETGNIAPARTILTEALRLSRTAQNARATVFAYFFLGKARLAQGRLRQAKQHYEEGLALHSSLPIAGVLHVGIAEILYETGDLSAARQHLDQALAMAERGGEIKPLVYANIVLGGLLPPEDAIQRLEHIASLTGWTLIYAWQTVWWLRAGNVAMGAYWLEDTRNLPHSEFERLVQARVMIALKQWDEAGELLDQLQDQATRDQRHGDLLKILLLKTLSYAEQKDNTTALRCLRQALELGEMNGYLSTFLDEGEVLHKLGLQLAHQHPENAYLRHILQQFPTTTSHPVLLPFGETLSQREIEVLTLMADGLSNVAIAQRLFLTVGTVKWHVHNIFGKLNVKSRTQAIKRAKELQLLSV